MNSVTLGDFSRPLQISKFIKDVHAGFQLLNLKNDALRRRSDGIKYSVSSPKNLDGKVILTSLLAKVKKVEEVEFEIAIRNLAPKD